MARLLRYILMPGMAMWSLVLHGQAVQVHVDHDSVITITPRKLWDDEVRVQGQGNKVPGIDLANERSVLHWIGDDPSFSLRTLTDTGWASASDSEDSIQGGAAVHWLRYHLLPDTTLKGRTLMLNVEVRDPFTIYLNGQQLVHWDDAQGQAEGMRDGSAAMHRVMLPLTLLCDGQQEVLALRLVTPPGSSMAATGLRMSLHARDSTFHLQRILMNYGVFIGVNVIILLMALVIGLAERHDRSWLLLAALSLVSALDTVCVLGGGMGVLGFADSVSRALRLSRILTVPWGMYLLILVLVELRGERTSRRVRRYTVGIGLITLFCLAVITMFPEVLRGSNIQFNDLGSGQQLFLLLLFVILALISVGVLAWFAIDEARLGIRLWRSKGYARWVGAGAVAASLFTLLLALASNLAGLGLSSWLSVIADYCSFVAVPVSVAVYLSIRSAHHTRLVTRQRDELDQEVQERTAELRAEKERSDQLLHNILPHEVAEELKDTGKAAAKHFERATVLFTDFRGFTQLSEHLSPDALVREIDTCFKAFDGLMDKWRMEKIKTIGDSYMAAGGLPDPSKGSPADVVHAALAMQDFMEELARQRQARGLPVFRMRVGIHCGPVVAGIVGVKKFQYDIWGDTVNTASRMESAGEEGRVNISDGLHELVKDEPGLRFLPRGLVEAKGKGRMGMWFVEKQPS